MSSPFSIVIITRNEARRIKDVIQAALRVTDDVIIVDSGSTDETLAIVNNLNIQMYSIGWNGYGANKNFGNEKAKNDWIISIDGDEVLSNQLIATLNDLSPKGNHIYQINSKVIYNGKWIKYSGWYPKWKNRVFNKKEVKWNKDLVHEDLEPLKNKSFVKLKGDIIHFSYDSLQEHRNKLLEYAHLKAEEMIRKGVKPSYSKKWLGPYFSFFKTLILNLGFLDGKNGWNIAKMNGELIKKEIQFFENLQKKSSL